MDPGTIVGVVVGAGVTIAVSGVGGIWYLSGRLSAIEGKVTAVEKVVSRELTPNGGDSLRDRVVRIEAHMYANRINLYDEPDGSPI